MKDFCIFTLGCRTNQTESQNIAAELIDSGYSASLNLIPAKNYIINTCSVTHEADSKSHQAVARILVKNPNANVFVMGCSSQFDKSEFLNKKGVKLVCGTTERKEFTKEIIKYLSGNKVAKTAKMPLRTRAMIKIQDGCDNFCSYCIVPYLRGRSKSRPLDEIINEVKNLSLETKEYSLTGICISDYKIDGKAGLSTLVTKLKDKHPARYRIGSLHPDIITKDFLETLKSTNFCEHFHLSVQSGSDTVLKRMNRHYTAVQVLEKIALIRATFKNPSITADFIAGFGNETEEEFLETCDFIKKAKFSDLHIFAYSERKGTAAINMPQIAKSIRHNRAKIIKNIAVDLKNEFLKTQIDTTHEVLMQKNNAGYTRNYIKVNHDALPNSLHSLVISENHLTDII